MSLEPWRQLELVVWGDRKSKVNSSEPRKLVSRPWAPQKRDRTDRVWYMEGLAPCGVRIGRARERAEYDSDPLNFLEEWDCA